ncbi:MAG: glycosyl hydrolase [Clostridiales bacterium]|nr:glycosyl hydrolase [Clostridiales bacterium]
MSVEDKIDLCCGANFWRSAGFEKYDLPAMAVSDGPHGVRFQADESDMLGINTSVPATCFPSGGTSGCSWDKDLLGEIGEAIAQEALSYGVDGILGPGLNIKRSPLCGRNFEYISEDPFLSGKLGASYIKEAQKTGVSACPKHFAANSQEYKRFSSNGHMDERTLREIYLSAFEEAVNDGKPNMLMTAYNKINGTYCSDNKWLITDVLRNEWGFDGLVVTDWGGMHDRVQGFKSGCDWSMPGGGTKHLQNSALAAYHAGTLSEQEIDACADRMITRMLNAAKARKKKSDFSRDKHHALAHKAAVQSAVLLKNDGILPLKSESVSLIGYMAKVPRYQGAGSSHINPTKLLSLRDITPNWHYSEGCDEHGDTNDALLADACLIAKESETCVVVAGLPDSYESEGFDRSDMKMPDGHIRMIEAVCDANPNTVVLLLCGSAVEVPWINKARAVLYMGLAGQASAEATYELLSGQTSPSGKLAETWPLRYEDVPCSEYYGMPHRDAEYREGIYVGYRYYETSGTPVRFPFGFGLSYTQFDYSSLEANDHKITVSVKNTGKTSGAEVVQLYISPPKAGTHRPSKELKGFEKVFLQQGETKQVTFELNDRSFAVWNDGWKIQKGIYTLNIASSVHDIQLTATTQVDGEDMKIPSFEAGSWYEAPCEKPSRTGFEKMIGHTVPIPKKTVKGQFTDENTIAEMAEHSIIMRIVKYFIEKTIAKMNGCKLGDRNPTFKMAVSSSVDSALFSLVISSCGSMPKNIAYGLLDMANGHMLGGIKRMLKKE